MLPKGAAADDDAPERPALRSAGAAAHCGLCVGLSLELCVQQPGLRPPVPPLHGGLSESMYSAPGCVRGEVSAQSCVPSQRGTAECMLHVLAGVLAASMGSGLVTDMFMQERSALAHIHAGQWQPLQGDRAVEQLDSLCTECHATADSVPPPHMLHSTQSNTRAAAPGRIPWLPRRAAGLGTCSVTSRTAS